MSNVFLARFEKDGMTRSMAFDKSRFDKESASSFLNSKGIQNFFFFFEPYEPIKYGDNSFLFKGEIGFDITLENLLPIIQTGGEIILDSFGGCLWTGLRIHDAIKMSENKPTVGVLGSCASSATLIMMGTDVDKRWMSENSRFLIHNPWNFTAGDDEMMRLSANELEKEKKNIAKIYAKESGLELDVILALMKEERFLNFEETKNFNFINKSKEVSQINAVKNDEMNKKAKEKLDTVETMLNGIKAMFKSNPKNIIVQDVNGIDIDFGDDIETLEEVTVGLKGVKANDVVAEGAYIIATDGASTEYVFEKGEVMEINATEPEPEETEVEELKEEIEELKEELETAQASVKKLGEIQAKFEVLQTEVKKLRELSSNVIPTATTPEAKKEKTNIRKSRK